MKQGTLVEIDNVRRAKAAITYLETRPIHEMVGLGLIYGIPGLGKTRFAKNFSIREGHVYLRLDSPSTVRSFLVDLYKAIMYKNQQPVDNVKGVASKILEDVVEQLQYDPKTIVIDEVDYAFANKKLLGAIRDIVDRTFAIIIMVGMADAKHELLKANAHYFDRCNAFVKFEPLTKKDINLYLRSVSEVKMDELLVDYITTKTRGKLRDIVKELRKIESYAKKNKLQNITLKQFKGE